MKRGVELEKRSHDDVKDAENFLVLLDLYWNSRVSHVALKTRATHKYDKVNVLPLTEVLKRFTEAAEARLSTYVREGISSKEQFVRLSKLALTRILVFNKRRPTEVSRVSQSSWLGEALIKRRR